MLAKAATGSAKNMAPKELTATSNAPSGKGWTWASACSKVTFVSPSRSATERARSSILADKSTPSTEPDGAMRASARVELPVPQPMSRTVSPARTAAARSRASPKPVDVAS